MIANSSGTHMEEEPVCPFIKWSPEQALSFQPNHQIQMADIARKQPVGKQPLGLKHACTVQKQQALIILGLALKIGRQKGTLKNGI